MLSRCALHMPSECPRRRDDSVMVRRAEGDDETVDDHSNITLSRKTIEMIGVDDVVHVRGKNGTETVLMAQSDSRLKDGYAQMSSLVKRNLCVKDGDKIRIRHCPTIEAVGIWQSFQNPNLTLCRPSASPFFLFSVPLKTFVNVPLMTSGIIFLNRTFNLNIGLFGKGMFL